MSELLATSADLGVALRAAELVAARGIEWNEGGTGWDWAVYSLPSGGGGFLESDLVTSALLWCKSDLVKVD